MRLLRSDIPERGCIYSNYKGIVLYTKGSRWIDKKGKSQVIDSFEVTIPGEGTLKFSSIKGIFDVLWSWYQEEISIERSEDFKRRLKHQLYSGVNSAENPESHPEASQFSSEWFDQQFYPSNRYEISDRLEESIKALDLLNSKTTPSNPSQKLAQAKYRQKEEVKEAAKARRRVDLDTKMEFRRAQKWMTSNPGKTLEDYFKTNES